MSRQYYMEAMAPDSGNALELHGLYDRNPNVIVASDNINDEIKGSILDAKDWLPFASEAYNISADINDYIMTPVVIMPSDLPNRNGFAFPYTELTRFSLDSGDLAFRSWKGKPTHLEHDNKVAIKAKGVVFASSLKPMKGFEGDIWKVLALCCFDRTKDSKLVNEILSGNSRAYSMGAASADYRCSVCGSMFSKHHCEHVDHPQRMGPLRTYSGRLAFWQAVDISGIEVSAVAKPAYESARSDEIIQMF